MTIENAKKLMCPFISTLCNSNCKADECMAWITTRTGESCNGYSVNDKPPEEGWEYDEEEDVWYRELPREEWQGYCKLIDEG